MITKKLTWNAIKDFKKYIDPIFTAVLVIMFLIWWEVRTYCWIFLDASSFQWVFSTLAQVFGTLLGLLVVSFVFLFGIFNTLIRDFFDLSINLEEDNKRSEVIETYINRTIEILEGFKEKNRDIDALLIENKEFLPQIKDDLASQSEDIENIAKRYVKLREGCTHIFMMLVFSLSLILIYSIIILPFSNIFIVNNVYAGNIILLGGIIFPILGLYLVIEYLLSIKKIVDLYKGHEDLSQLYKGLHKKVKDLYDHSEELYKMVNNKKQSNKSTI